MSTTPQTSRGPARGTSHTPATPDSSRPALTWTMSLNIAPKSEYLRNALEATRARQGTPTPSPIETKAEVNSEVPSPQPEPQTTSSEPDEWLEQALADADACPPSPLGRRRPSDTPPRARTTRELRQETDSLKRVVWDLNMKLEMARKQNNQLKDELEMLREQNEELKPLEQENKDLWKENDELRNKLQDMEDDIAENENLHHTVLDLEAELARLRTETEELQAIQADSIKHMEAHDNAILEGAEIIHNFEIEHEALKDENAKLKEQLAALQASVGNCVQVDGCPREMYPTRVYSIDESRPSTSHFDSDYYSQPASPQVKPSIEPVESRKPSERAKSFLEKSKDYRKSAQDLKKRISDVSLKGLKPQTSIPEVPEIPQELRDQAAQTTQDQIYRAVKRTPRRQRALTPLDTVQVSPVATRFAPPVTPTGQSSRGLRGLYRVGKSSVDHSVRDSRPSSSNTSASAPFSSLDARPVRTPRPSTSGEHSRVFAPPRTSSKQADTSYSSSEKLRQDSVLGPQSRSSHSQHRSVSDLQSSSSSLKDAHPQPHPNSEWVEVPPPPSIISEAPSTTNAALDQRDQDRWWKEIDRLRLSGGGNGVGGVGRRDIVSGLDALASGGRPGNTSGTPLTSPYAEKDFFFNGAEDEEQFMKRARGYKSSGGRT